MISYFILWIAFFGLKNKIAAKLEKKEYFSFLLIFFSIRGISLFSSPIFDDDWARFLWDGKMTLEFGNPYLGSPESFFPYYGLFGEKWDYILSNINHPIYPTIYLMTLQFVFFLGVLLTDTELIGIKLIFILIETVGVFIPLYLWKINILPQKSFKEGLLWIAFSPIWIFQFHFEMHPDIVGISLLFLACLILYLSNHYASNNSIDSNSSISKRIKINFYLPEIVASVLFVMAILTKPFPILMFIFFVFYSFRIRRLRIFVFMVGFLLVISILLIWTFESITDPYSFFVNFEFNSSIYYIIRRFTDQTIANLFYFAIHFFIFTMLGIYLLVLFYRKTHEVDWNINSVFYLFLYFFPISLILGPLANPWYLCWIIPFLPFYSENRFFELKSLHRNFIWIRIWLVSIILSYFIPLYATESVFFSYFFDTNSDIYSHSETIQMAQFIPVYIVLILGIFFEKKED